MPSSELLFMVRMLLSPCLLNSVMVMLVVESPQPVSLRSASRAISSPFSSGVSACASHNNRGVTVSIRLAILIHIFMFFSGESH